MTNNEKFHEHITILNNCKAGRFLSVKPSVWEMERAKYSNDPIIRKLCALTEFADFLYTEKMIGKEKREKEKGKQGVEK